MPTSKNDIERLLQLRHHDPHQILGVHPQSGGWVARAYKPGADGVWLRRAGQPDLELKQAAAYAGLFEAEFEAKEYPKGYQLKVSYPSGMQDVRPDAYAFAPSLGEMDLHLFGEGQHWRLWEKLGAHRVRLENVEGISFSVWAPGAAGASVVGDFNSWDGRLHVMRSLGGSGIWELFIPGLGAEFLYKFEIRPKLGPCLLKTDPLGRSAELPPGTASRYHDSAYRFKDGSWMDARARSSYLRQPMSVYELHLGSWRRVPEEGFRSLTYKELAKELPSYVKELGFTHIELMPIMEHPFGPSWGYQVGSYYAPTARYGTPDEFRELVDALHQAGIGILLDWVPAHFPKDAHALGRFSGEALYEHLDPRQGEHPDWGTFIFNFGRKEVRNFLIANALYWLKEFHLDGLRIDAVASMLYLDYSRKQGEWIPNPQGGRENIEAIDFLKQLNAEVYAQNPGTLVVAEESTAWPGVSRPTFDGGLGFGFKWNMGWMHDVLEYFSKDPVHRRYHHDRLTFGLLYAWTENFILPLSHDEVVHGKGSLMNKMPGDRWQKFANLRALYGFMWAHPGKKLLFMGGEFGQWNEWKHDGSLDWHLLQEGDHEGLRRWVRDLNKAYRAEAALWDNDAEAAGFQWIEANGADDNCVIFFRQARDGAAPRVLCAGNFSPVPRREFRVGLPGPGRWSELLNSDASIYGGANLGNSGGVVAEAKPWNGQPYSALLTLPPLAVIWLKENK
jgi:1,4-alpha-glucan branching enzyme